MTEKMTREQLLKLRDRYLEKVLDPPHVIDADGTLTRMRVIEAEEGLRLCQRLLDERPAREHKPP